MYVSFSKVELAFWGGLLSEIVKYTDEVDEAKVIYDIRTYGTIFLYTFKLCNKDIQLNDVRAATFVWNCPKNSAQELSWVFSKNAITQTLASTWSTIYPGKAINVPELFPAEALSAIIILMSSPCPSATDRIISIKLL